MIDLCLETVLYIEVFWGMWIGKDVCKLNLESNRNQCENTGKKNEVLKSVLKYLHFKKLWKVRKDRKKWGFKKLYIKIKS